MPRRSRRPAPAPLGTLVVLVIVGVAFKALWKDTLVVILVGGVFWVLWTLLSRQLQLRRAREIITAHAEELGRHRRRLRLEVNYGVIDDSRWQKEKETFKTKIVRPRLNRFLGYPERRIDRAIEEAAASASPKAEGFRPDMQPVAYEQFVADTLARNGWITRLTKASGDQGIDIIAQRANVKAVIQCKLYSQPVGNGAVQEIIGGRAYENANVAAVVTNAGFTRAARELASTAGVLLLHHDELSKLNGVAGNAHAALTMPAGAR